MNKTTIITISIACGVALLLVLVILYFTVFLHARQRKLCRDLVGRFEKSHATLFGQDSQFIKRLETISSMNLTYVEDYMEWNKKFKDIRDVSDASASATVNQIQDLLSERKYGDIKNNWATFKKTIDDYEAAVNGLDTSLKRKFQDEDSCRQLAFTERERLRKAKQDYYVKQGDLALVATSFDAIFKKMDSLFDSVEQNIENAQYLDAKTTLSNEIAPVNQSLTRALSNLPNICISITSVIPDKLSSLNGRYEEMVKEGYPLHHILLKGDLEAMDDQLTSLAKRVQSFEFKDVDKMLDAMSHKIDSYLEAFDKEKEARKTFESESEGISTNETGLESVFINLCHALPAIRKIYVIGSDEQQKIDSIQNIINKAGASKRSLDTYTNSATKQPYTILVEKMRGLDQKAKEAGESITSFQNYLSSLKSDSEKAARALPEYYEKLKAAETEVRNMRLIPVHHRFDDSIDSIYKDIDGLYATLSSTPIDVKKVNASLAALKEVADSTFEAISKTKEELDKAETEMVAVNRRRASSAEVNSLSAQAEGLFFSGEFASAYETAFSAERHSRESV